MAESASDTVHVLVCDDEPDIRDMMSTYLQRRGYTVSMAESGAALDRVLEGHDDIQLIILDINMPGEDGLSVLRRLRTEMSLPIIMSTAAGDTVDRVVGLELGADDYLAKPVDLRELELAEIGERLQRPRLLGVTLRDPHPGTPRKQSLHDVIADETAPAKDGDELLGKGGRGGHDDRIRVDEEGSARAMLQDARTCKGRNRIARSECALTGSRYERYWPAPTRRLQRFGPPNECPDGGIGRRAVFRWRWGQPRGGSSPLLGTNQSANGLFTTMVSSRPGPVEITDTGTCANASTRRIKSCAAVGN